MRIGVVGCGDISGIYLHNMTKVYGNLEVVGVCDLIPERSSRAATNNNIGRIYADVDELLADDNVDIVLNITRPVDHFNVSMAVLRAGKHLYTEKPLGITMDEGRQITALAKEKGLYVGCSPDTFLGAGLQTCRKVIDAGLIGEPIGGTAHMIVHGHESWHPNPDFYYQRGGGPMLDMGPYYVTALLNFLGRVDAVSGCRK